MPRLPKPSAICTKSAPLPHLVVSRVDEDVVRLDVGVQHLVLAQVAQRDEQLARKQLHRLHVQTLRFVCKLHVGSMRLCEGNKEPGGRDTRT